MNAPQPRRDVVSCRVTSELVVSRAHTKSTNPKTPTTGHYSLPGEA
jgi:hypothetical protein